MYESELNNRDLDYNDLKIKSSSKDFIESIERVATVSLDRKEGVKLIVNKDNVKEDIKNASTNKNKI